MPKLSETDIQYSDKKKSLSALIEPNSLPYWTLQVNTSK